MSWERLLVKVPFPKVCTHSICSDSHHHVVKHGIDTQTGKAFAVKIVDRNMVKKENMEEQLRREIAIMKILKHKNIVNMREVLQSQKNIYIVLELVTGGELFDRIGTHFFQHVTF